MNSIDERLVAMRFDNSQFEKGVKHSMKTLQELREATNLDDVAGSIGEVSKSINQGLKFDTPAKSAGIFSKALTSMGKVAKKTFNAATFPLQALGRSLQSLGKYTRAVLGIDLASQLVHTGEQVIRAFTIDPLKAGWGEYELKMDSIKTIMTGTVKTYTDAMTKKDPQFLYDEEKHLEYVKKGLEELNTYADQTVYSFSDMTNNIGKFTNAGVDFETAVDAIKGVANAAAHAGQGATQASMAMYNISQSLGMGYLGMMDWRSIENANMATLTFKQTLIDLGVALGQLKRDEKSGKLFTINEQGVMDESLEVTAENLRETLSKKWVNKDVLLNALRVYSGEFTEDELRSLKNLSEEEKAALKNIGEEAALAATQVRTFTKMWDALKEAAQSGWAISWELIFGDMNEATDFWTGLNDRFSKLLENQADARNDLLHAWRGQEKSWDIENKVWTWIDKPGAEDGREILKNSLNELLDTIQRIGSAISEAWTSVFGEINADTLMTITKRFSAFTKKFSEWLGKGDDKNSRISKMTKGLKGIFSLFKGAGTTIKGAVTTIAQTLRLDKLLDSGIDIFSKAGEWLSGIGESISGVWETIGQTEIMQKLSGFFGDLWTSVSKFFTEPNAETGNTGFVDWLSRLIGRLTELWTEFTQTPFYQGATNIWDKIVQFFTPKTIMGKMGNTWTEESDFVATIKNAFTSVKDFFTEVQGWEIWGKIGGFFDPIIDKVKEFFAPKTTKEMVKLPKNMKVLASAIAGDVAYVPSAVKTEDSPFVAWIKKAFEDLKAFFDGDNLLQMFSSAKDKMSEVGQSILQFFTPKTIIGKMGNTWTEDSDFVKVIKNAFERIKAFFSGDGEDSGQAFFGNFIENAKTQFGEKFESFKTWAEETRITIGQWFDGNETWKAIVAFFRNVGAGTSGEESEGGETKASFIDTAKDKFIEKWEEFKAWAEEIKITIGEWFENNETWKSVKQFFSDLGTSVSTLFGGSEGKTDAQLDKEGGFFSGIVDSVTRLVESVKDVNVFDTLSGFFKSFGEMLSAAAEAVKASSFGNTAGALIKSVVNSLIKILGVIENLLSHVKELGDIFYPDTENAITIFSILGSILKAVITGVVGIVGAAVTGATSLAISSAAAAFKQIGKIFMFLGIFMASLTAFTAIMAIIPVDARNFVTGALVVVGAIVSIITILVTISKIMESTKKSLPTVGNVVKGFFGEFFENLLESLVKWVGIIVLFRYGLPPVIEALKGLNVDALQILSLFGGVTLLIAAISGLSILFHKLKVDAVGGFTGGLALSAALIGFFAPIILALQSLGGLVNLLPDTKKAVHDGASLIGDIVKTFNEAAYGREISDEEAVVDLYTLVAPLAGVGAAGDLINIEGLKKAEQAMEIVRRIFETKVNDGSGLGRWLNGDLSISDMLVKVVEMGDKLTEFNDKVKDVDFSNSIDALRAWESLADILSSLTYVKQNYTSFEYLFEDLMGALSDSDKAGWTLLEEFMASFGQVINKGLETAAVDITANPLIAAIAASIRAGTPDIQSAIRDAVLNTTTSGSQAGVTAAAEQAGKQATEQAGTAWDIIQKTLYGALDENGKKLLGGDLLGAFNEIAEAANGPGGIVGALLGGTLANGLVGENAGLLPFGLKGILEQAFGTDLDHLIPKGFTLDSIVGMVTSGDTEGLAEVLNTALGLDLTSLDIKGLSETTITDLSKMLGMIEGYEGSAIQGFLAKNDPNAKIIDLINQYLPMGEDGELDLSDPSKLLANMVGAELGDFGKELNEVLPSGIASLLDPSAWAKWLGVPEEQIDFSTLSKAIESIVPTLIASVMTGLKNGFEKTDFSMIEDLSLFDSIWNYLGIDSAEIKLTDLQTDIETVVASITPTAIRAIKSGIEKGFAEVNIFGDMWTWLGIDQASMDTSSLSAVISSAMPQVTGEIKKGLKEGLKDEPILSILLDRMLASDEVPNFAVTPIIDSTDLDSNPLLALQNGSIKLTGEVVIQQASLDGVVNAVNTQGRNIVGAVNNMRGEIRGVAAAIRNITIVLDTNVIAGAVDDKLGNQATLNGRTGTSGGSHGPRINTNLGGVNYVKT